MFLHLMVGEYEYSFWTLRFIFNWSRVSIFSSSHIFFIFFSFSMYNTRVVARGVEKGSWSGWDFWDTYLHAFYIHFYVLYSRIGNEKGQNSLLRLYRYTFWQLI